jgi:hypothetical protein
MTSWKDICLKKNENVICEKNEKNVQLIKFDTIKFNNSMNKKYICIQYNTSFNDWFNFYENELFNLYKDIRNYIIEREYITAPDVNENFIKFSKLIYLHSSKKLC